MIKKFTLNKDILTPTLCYAIVYCFLLFLNACFPTQSDDIGRKLEGVHRAIDSYMTWNGRFGELLLVTFGSYLSTTPFFAPINSFVGASVIMLIFVLVFGKLPQKTAKDISCFSIFFAFILFDLELSFGSVFYWAAGSFNYLWAWFFILLILTPVSLFWKKVQFTKKHDILLLIFGIPLAIIAGWSSEFGIIIILFWISSIIFAKIKRIKLPLWYYTSLLSFIIGWTILYACPGLRVRAQSVNDYISIMDILKLGPNGLKDRLFRTFNDYFKSFYFESFSFISLFLMLYCIFNDFSIKKLGYTFLSIFFLMLCLFFLPKFLYLLCTIIICIIYTIILKRKNVYFSSLFLAASCIFVAAFLFIGSTIQMKIPKRSAFQFTLLNLGLISINMSYFYDIFAGKRKILQIITVSCICFTLLSSLFVAAECFHMSKKWKSMEESIIEQKNNGIKDIVIDKNTFKSLYWSYGDWENPNECPDTWPNTTYAEYYDVNSLIAK